MNLKTLILSGLVAVGPMAFAVDFEDLNNNGSSYTLYGPTLNSGGFKFDSINYPTNSDALASWTAGIGAPYTGSVAIFANYGNDEVMMTKIGGGFFDVFTIDVADVFRTAGNSLTIYLTGTHADNSQTTVRFNIGGNSGNLVTYGVGLSAVKDVRIYDGNDGTQGQWFQFDNINTVPEPATMAALGIGALALLRRRRNSK